MLYIKKTNAPAAMKHALAEIKSMPEWKSIQNGDTVAIRAQFDALPKEDIRKALLREQHSLCAYCMKRISNEELHMTIEHWVPLSKNKDRALDYNNFLGVCRGGADVSVEKRRVLCCDGSKGAESKMVINPLDHSMMEQIAYHKDGTIYFQPSAQWDAATIHQIEQDMNKTLCLNGKMDRDGKLLADTATCLLKGRKDAARQAFTRIEHLANHGKLTAKRLEKEIKQIQAKEDFPEFAGTIVFFLNRKYKYLLAQEK